MNKMRWLALGGFLFTALSLTFEISYANGINVLEASYGLNCGAHQGNATADIAYRCNGKQACEYTIHHRRIGDPAVGCEKNYIVYWTCGGNQRFHKTAPPEAGFGSRVRLTCQRQMGSNTISVRSATYGANCGAPDGNATYDLRSACNGKTSCNYRVDHRAIGDPAVGCRKWYEYSWSCGSGARQGRLRPEASGKVARLSCR